MRLAWFSPFPPVRTGISAVSAELVAMLRGRGYTIDAYPAARAHDFPWTHQQRPYDLIVYQFGNSSHHDYEWAYALRYAGLVVLHDTRLHHARAAFLLREKRAADYRAEFCWNHPDVSPDAAELGVAGYDSHLYYEWPMTRALVASARLTAAHANAECQMPNDKGQMAKAVSIRLGHGRLVEADERARARAEIRRQRGIADDAVVFVCAGGITPEKRIPQVLAAFADTLRHAPDARLMLAGATASHYDVHAGIAAHGLGDRVIVTGYVESDAALTDHLAAADVSLNLRWPTAGEMSGPWLRALAAGVATVITDLAHLGHMPSLDPRTWRMNGLSDSGVRLLEEPKPKAQSPTPVCVAIDILDENHSLRLAMRRLATDAELRARLGRAGQSYWLAEHTPEVMADDYERAIALAVSRPAPDVALPAHMRSAADSTLHRLLAPFGLDDPF